MLRKIYITLITLVVTGVAAMAQSGAIKGTVVDAKNNEPIPFVGIVVLANGSQVASGQTDFDGNYTIKPVNPGKYTVRAVILGYEKIELGGVQVASDKIAFANIKMSSTTTELKEFTKVEYKVPLLEKDQTSTGGTLTRDDIANAPTRSINSVVSTTAGVGQADDNRALNVKGGRSDATVYYVDGVKVRGGSPRLPNAGVEQITVITGGIPAQYGDATSGVISITTRGPSRDFTGGAEIQTSHFTDSYDYNLAALNASGPLYSKRQGNVKTPIVGFFIAGEFESNKDANPSSIGSYKLKDNVYNNLLSHPITITSNNTFVNNGEYITFKDIDKINARQNAASKLISLNGRVDYKPSTNSTLALGGTFLYNNPTLFGENDIFNFANNREQITKNYRVYGRYTQKFGSQENEKNSSVIKNAFYSVMVDYSNSSSVSQDKRFKDDIFKYGYVGKFSQLQKKEKYRVANDTIIYEPKDSTVRFTKGGGNDNYQVYTQNAFNYVDANKLNVANVFDPQLANLGGFLNGQGPANIYGMFNNIGVTSGGYAKSNSQQFRITAQGSADVKNHAILFGFEYEQVTERAFSVGATGLWTRARQLESNIKPISSKLDSKKDSLVFRNDSLINGQNFHIYDHAYSYSPEDKNSFDQNFRKSLGMTTGVGQAPLNIDNYDPSQLSLSMFNANELLNGGNSLVSYYGYDYTGNVISSKQSFEEFFKNPEKRTIGAFQPNYIAGYIQDKFAFRDLIFNVGVRVDRYDANQKVLKDKYFLYEVTTAGQLSVDKFGAKPSNIGDNYSVYVDNIDNPTKVVGYKNGDVFYDNRGTRIDGEILKQGTTKVNPYLVKGTPTETTVITSSGYNTNVFKDYEAQINFMPRISFSFPISEEALFFAHYDVLTQRPGSGESRLNPLSYLYLDQNAGGLISNPDLKPSKTTDYELGFKQKLSNSCAITLSGFYRELRNQIQIQTLKYAYPIDYQTFGNRDFGTVKGLTAAFDLRRTNNLRLTASYTLQFADGTGSSSTSATNLSSTEPDLRTPIALDFDQRHNIVTSIDYRYESGADYNGPVWFGKRIFENTGLNLIVRAGSGTPYTRKGAAIDITDQRGAFLVGTINGSRLPWTYRTDLKLDRDIVLHLGKGEDKKTLNLNAYILVQNLFDTQNILGVYSYTGSPTDDGFLTSAIGKTTADRKTDAQSYRDLYTVYLANPSNFSLPRRIRVGVRIDF